MGRGPRCKHGECAAHRGRPCERGLARHPWFAAHEEQHREHELQEHDAEPDRPMLLRPFVQVRDRERQPERCEREICACALPRESARARLLQLGRLGDPIADLQVSPLGSARCELDHRLSVPRRCRPPRPEVRRDLRDPVLLVEEDDVDREAHERRVHRRRRTQENPLLALQRRSSEESLHAHERRVRKDTALTHGAPVLEPECDFQLEPHVDVVVVIGQRERRPAESE